MEADGQAAATPENVRSKLSIAAHHEAGHIVVAASLGLKLRPEGISVDPQGEGLACYCKHPDGSDTSRERIILSAFAGCFAQDRFCEQESYARLEYLTIIWSGDWREARQILSTVSDEYLGSRQIDAVQKTLEGRSQELVAENWATIAAVANALLAKDWEPLKPLTSGSRWSAATTAKYLTGDEVIAMLRGFGINAVSTADC